MYITTSLVFAFLQVHANCIIPLSQLILQWSAGNLTVCNIYMFAVKASLSMKSALAFYYANYILTSWNHYFLPNSINNFFFLSGESSLITILAQAMLLIYY